MLDPERGPILIERDGSADANAGSGAGEGHVDPLGVGNVDPYPYGGFLK